MKLFLNGFIQVFFVSINTVLVIKNNFIGIFICSFLVSFIWSNNIKKIVFSNSIERIKYALGASFGSIIGILLIKFICEKQ
jgi:hypothetical protein